MDLPARLDLTTRLLLLAATSRRSDEWKSYYGDLHIQVMTNANPLHAAICKTDCGMTLLTLKDQSFNPQSEVKLDQEQYTINTWQPFVDLHL